MNRKTQQPTVRFKNPNVSSSEEEPEEADYVDAAVCPVDKIPATSDKKSPSFTQSVPTVAGCWLILFVIVALRIYFTSVISANNLQNLNQLKHNQTTLLDEIQNLTTRNQELETEKNNLTEQIKDLETKKNELSVSQAQKIINAYCPKENNRRQCKACEKGWEVFQSRCYAYNDAEPSDQKTWEEAREDCRGKISDLVVVVDANEKKYIDVTNWGIIGYWIGLRVEGGRWKWFDGTNLTDSSWIDSPVDGHCAVSDQKEGWKSVNCGERRRWLCEKTALSL